MSNEQFNMFKNINKATKSKIDKFGYHKKG